MWRINVLAILVLALLVGQAHAVTVQTVTTASAATTNTGANVLCKDAGNPSAVNTCNTADIKNATTASVQVKGTGAFTVTFKVSVDRTNFENQECFPSTDRTSSAQSTTSSGIWDCKVFGKNLFFAPITGCAACNVTITVGLGSAGVN